jgi:GntR family transcriptional regulator
MADEPFDRTKASLGAPQPLHAWMRDVPRQRVRHLNGEPISIDRSHFPADIGARLFGRDRTHEIFTLLEDELDIPLGGADITIEAGAADGDAAPLPRICKGEPVLRVERLTCDTAGRPIDFEHLTFRGDKYQYQFRVEWRQAV